MERREFFRSLIAGGATVKVRAEHRNRKAHHQNEVIHHGPMEIPERIASIVAEHPAIKRTTHGGKLVSRYAEGSWTWLFRCQVPATRLMIGEIVRTPEGNTRVHCWSAARPDRHAIDTPMAILARKRPPSPVAAPQQLVEYYPMPTADELM